jgi:phosphoserine phosphatase RsbU/P
VTTAIAFLAPSSVTGPTAALSVLVGWPVALSAPTGALAIALQMGLVANVFAMSYLKRLTRRTWVAVLAATILGMVSLMSDVGTFPSEEWTSFVVKVALAAASALAFIRFGALPVIAALFVWCGLQTTGPLLAAPVIHANHFASGIWSLAFCFVPLVVAELAAMRPRDYGAEEGLPAHVRRALDRLRISEEFEVARRVQAGLLPAQPPGIPGLDVAGICVPASEVGGDYFDYFDLGDGRLAVAVGDVSGKGVPAAIFMTLTKSYMVTQASRAGEPAVVLSRVNAHLKRNLARGTFVTMALAVIDRAGRKVTYTRAGHNPPLLVRANGEGEFLNASGLALGSAPPAVFDGLTKAEVAELLPGDLLLLYTDGVTEAMNVRADEFGEERLATRVTALAASGATAQAIVNALLKDLRNFRGRAMQHDDITIVAIRVG